MKTNIFDLRLFKLGFRGTQQEFDLTRDGKLNILNEGAYKRLESEVAGLACGNPAGSGSRRPDLQGGSPM